ncbi:MAG TPA: hypothetical protein VE445_02690 [Nitrososphaeraceae archaeon]|nr:hypothetical protein [Nitrososphaeraceae archaeon]
MPPSAATSAPTESVVVVLLRFIFSPNVPPASFEILKPQETQSR